MTDNQIIDVQFIEKITEIDITRAFLEDLYKDPEIATPFNKPVIATLMSACEYLSINLSLLRRKIVKI